MRSSGFQMLPGKIEKAQPVGHFDGMAAGTVVVAHMTVRDDLVHRRGGLRIEAGLAKKPIHIARVVGGQILAARIGPQILRAAGHVNRTGARHAINMCWSTGRSSSLRANFAALRQSQ